MFCALVCLGANHILAQSRSVRPLEHAHAHNDYEHPRPLLDALDHGFTSLEADVYLVDGELLVAHDFNKVSKSRTLESLYLGPMSQLVREHGGKVFPDGPVVTLLVDIKRDGKAAYVVLDKLLQSYESMISVTRDGVFAEKAITVVVSGDRPIPQIIASNPRFVGFDGRLGDLDSEHPASLMPLVSDNWTLHFKYRGSGDFNQVERSKLKDIITKAHDKGRRVRFWATPESQPIWTELLAARVDLIGTDRLSQLADFLRNAPQPKP